MFRASIGETLDHHSQIFSINMHELPIILILNSRFSLPRVGVLQAVVAPWSPCRCVRRPGERKPSVNSVREGEGKKEGGYSFIPQPKMCSTMCNYSGLQSGCLKPNMNLVFGNVVLALYPLKVFHQLFGILDGRVAPGGVSEALTEEQLLS